MNSNSNDSIVLTELNSADSLRPSVQVECALQDIRDEYQTPIIDKIPFTEIAALGGAFAGAAKKLAEPAGKGIYRCVFPAGVQGKLALAKDGSGALGAIMDGNKIVGQARWQAVDQVIGPELIEATMIAVAVLAVVKQINDIKDGQKEIIGILERDKKSQLLVDYDILSKDMDTYHGYWENHTQVALKLKQVMEIKRNAMKDIRSYTEELRDLLKEKNNLLKMHTASSRIGKLLDRFVHYKLALNVFALAEYMEVMLAKNFNAQYLTEISEEIRNCAFEFITLYSECYEKIETLRTEAVTVQAAGKAADISRGVGNFIGKIPVIKNGPVDEFLVGVGDHIDDSEEKRLNRELAFFMQHKDSGIVPVAEHIETINKLANKPVVMLYDNNVISFCEYQKAV